MRHDLMRGAGGAILTWVAMFGFASTCEAGPPADPIGTWKLTYTCPDGNVRDCVLTVTREGQGLKASCRGEGGNRAARAVTFRDGILTVQVDGQYAGAGYQVTYRGQIEGDGLRGDVGWSYLWASGSFAFEGKRVVEDTTVGLSVRGAEPADAQPIAPAATASM